MLGLATVALGISDLRRSFGLPSTTLEMRDEVWEAIRRTWGDLLRKLGRKPRPPNIVGVGAATLGVGTMRARARVKPGPDATLSQRVDLLERVVDGLEDRADKLEDDLEQETKERKDEAAIERRERVEQDEWLEARVRNVATGGLRLQTLGLLWLVVGVVLATWSPELGRLVTSPRIGCVGPVAAPDNPEP